MMEEGKENEDTALSPMLCGTGLALYPLARSNDLVLDLWNDRHSV